MVCEQPETGENRQATPATSSSSEATIAHFISDRGNRRVLCDWLEKHYEVVTGENPTDVLREQNVDLCILDPRSFELHRDSLIGYKNDVVPQIIPYLLIGEQNKSGLDPTVAEHIDEVLSIPISQRELSIRIRSLLRIRELSRELEAKNARLEQKTEQLEYLMKAAAHDLRNPLTIAKGYLEQIDDGESVEAVKSALAHIETLIDNLLTVDKIEQDPSTSARESVNLESIVETAWERVRTDEATLQKDSLAEHRIYAVPELLEQLLVNLFRNAIEHVADSVTIRVGSLDFGDGFYVVDDGPGIPAGERNAVFEKEYSTKGGSGFGLSIVTRVVDHHDWELHLTEGDLGGAKFEISMVEAVN